jgi:hypothetical protein
MTELPNATLPERQAKKVVRLRKRKVCNFATETGQCEQYHTISRSQQECSRIFKIVATEAILTGFLGGYGRATLRDFIPG